VDAFEAAAAMAAYVVVAHPAEAAFCRALLATYGLKKLAGVVAGGGVRQESAAAGVRALPDDCSLVAVHDAARPLLTPELLEEALETAGRLQEASGYPVARPDGHPGYHPGAALVMAVPARETIKLVDSNGLVRDTPARSEVWVAQTPQIFQRELLLQAYAAAERDGFEGTDDASLVERLGITVAVCRGSYDNIKVTTPEDLRTAAAILERRRSLGRQENRPFASLASPPAVRVGIGYDVHACSPDRPLMLGGVEIPDAPGLAGHSDADAALHALMDACLGAAGLPDIGHLFPPGDRLWQDAPSLALLATVRSRLADAGCTVCQADLVIAAEAPRLAPYIEMMRQRIAAVLGIPPGSVGIKATTGEGLGFIGRREGIAAWAVATVLQRGLQRE
jgi:2-C-methyl-D-erythritol 2,4-cyclodiphosphate synthase